jgi:hypothetical protein
MADNDKMTEEERIACEICLKEVPISEAKSEEASDYFFHFCGIDCYTKWKEQETPENK